jgi:hypothetical protein
MNELQLKFDNKNWRFAKTMPKIPHYYARRSEWGDEKDFEKVVQYIRDNGVAERFFSKSFIYFYMGGWKYWTMGEPLNETQVINRASA